MADHPVKVPPELFTEWLNEAMVKTSLNAKPGTIAAVMADRAAQWGADQELEACCKWVGYSTGVRQLRAARRPKPPTLAEQAGAAHARASFGKPGDRDILAAALNRLAELEAQQ